MQANGFEDLIVASGYLFALDNVMFQEYGDGQVQALMNHKSRNLRRLMNEQFRTC